jgi:glycosyltransferase involved in cell wall biosynthesis
MHQVPKISIITPSFNQGQYIEQTIKSVISQDNFKIEYIIIDGGSTDATVGIIKHYEKEITYWVSEKDEGQSQAINKGMALATGDIVGWLNSDDIYLPNALAYAVAALDTSKAEVCFGNCIHFKQSQSAVEAWGSDVVNRATTSELENYDYIIQPSSFWTRKAWELAGPLREDLHFAFDWEWFLRAKAAGVVFHSIPYGLSMYRIHDAHKSGSGGNKRQQEIASIYKVYSLRYHKLYEMVRQETFACNDFKSRVVRKILTLCAFLKSSSMLNIQRMK